MKKFKTINRNLKLAIHRWTSQIIDFSKLTNGLLRFLEYFKDWINYSRMEGAEQIKLINTYPCLNNKTSTTGFDSHYFYQDIWAFKKIYESKCNYHVDIGSKVEYIGFLTVITKVIFVDIRPLIAHLENFKSIKGNILSLPFVDNSITSLSCLHVAEHIGLGRYGDSLDPLGTEKAIKELTRVLAPKGNLYFSLPIGILRLCFNAHRIHSTEQILNYFSDLNLAELSGIDDSGKLIRNINRKRLDSSNYGCGLFHFTKINKFRNE